MRLHKPVMTIEKDNFLGTRYCAAVLVIARIVKQSITQKVGIECCALCDRK